MQISDHAAASTHSCTGGSIYLYFPSVLYNKLPSLTWRNIYMATVPVISFQFSPYYCAILENNDMTEPFP